MVQSRYQAPNFNLSAVQTIAEIIFAKPDHQLRQSSQLKKAYPHVNVGDVLGRITADGKYRRVPRCLLNANTLASAVSFVCKDENGIIEPPFIAGEVLLIGSDTTTVTSVVPSTGTVNCTAITNTHSLGAVVLLNTLDGSEVAVGIASTPVQSALYDSNNKDVNFLLDVDYTEDIILQAALVKSKLRGVCDSTTKTQLGISDLSPAFDAYLIR